jgi:hypothetical protein
MCTVLSAMEANGFELVARVDMSCSSGNEHHDCRLFPLDATQDRLTEISGYLVPREQAVTRGVWSNCIDRTSCPLNVASYLIYIPITLSFASRLLSLSHD